MTTGLYETNREALVSVYPHFAASVPEQAPHPADLEWIEPDYASLVDPGADMHIAVGFTSCQSIQMFFDHIQQHDLNHPINRRLVLLDSRMDRFAQWLTIDDWTLLFDSDRCLVHLAPTIEQAVHHLCGKYPPLTNASASWALLDSSLDQADLDSARARFEAIRDDFRQRVSGTIRQASMKNKTPFPVRTRWFSPGHNAIQDACVEATRRLGYEAIRMQWKKPLYRFVRNSAWMTSYQQQPFDTAIFLNATPVSFSRNTWLGELPLHRAAWFVDHPLRYIEGKHDLAGCDRIGVFDRSYIPMLQQWTDVPVVEVRTGIGVDWHQATNDEALSSLDIAFVGELGTQGFLPYEIILQNEQPDLMNRIRDRFFDLDVTRTLDCSTVFAPMLAERGLDYAGVWIEYIENRATALRRRFFLEALASEGLTIFGDTEWGQGKWSGTLHPCWAGRRVEYRGELPRVYANAKININLFHVQCMHSLNPRVYDVLACGGFLLTQFSPALKDEFVIGKDLVVFHSRDEMLEKARYYLAHPKERAEIAASGQQRALAKCRYDDRIRTLLPARLLPSGDQHYAYLCR